MRPQDRQSQIIDRVARDGEASVEALALAFDVSVETIRRDLAALAARGALQKVHGGARRMRLHAEGSFDQRMAEAAEAKGAIAAAVAGIVTPGETCFIDTGTTTLACAQALAATPDLTVITNSHRIARTIATGQGRARVFLLGGSYAPQNGETVGPMVLDQIGHFSADIALIGAAALDAEAGATDSDFDEAAVARAMCAAARRVVVAVHADKIGRRAAHRICRLDDIDVLVCDRVPGDAFRAALDAAGVALWQGKPT